MKINWVFLIFLLLLSCEGRREKGEVIAKVGDEVLTLEMLDEIIPSQYKERIGAAEKKGFVLRWINNEVLYQEAVRRNLDRDPLLRQQLKRLEKELLVSKLIELETKNHVRVTEEEVKRYYQDHREDFLREEDEFRLLHFLTKTREGAYRIRRELLKGMSPEGFIHRGSINRALISYEDTGYVTLGQMEPEVAKVVLEIGIGRVSRPIKTKLGYHVIKLLDKKRRGTPRGLELVRKQIEARIRATKYKQCLNKLLAALKSKADIWINWEPLKEGKGK